MSKDKYKKLGIRLGVLWVVLAVVLFLGYYGACSYIAKMRNVHKANIIFQYTDLLILAVIFIFTPMLYFIQRFFRKAQVKGLAIVARIMFIYQAVGGAVLALVRILSRILFS